VDPHDGQDGSSPDIIDITESLTLDVFGSLATAGALFGVPLVVRDFAPSLDG
tara:strand:- start:37 stop:192 length:156 start_codon:yes stop_codon:yes gene_type:complete